MLLMDIADALGRASAQHAPGYAQYMHSQLGISRYRAQQQCAVSLKCRSWLAKLAGLLSTPEQAVPLTDADLAFLNGLFEQYVDAGLAHVRSSKCQEVIATVDINLVTSLTYLLQVVYDTPHRIDLTSLTYSVALPDEVFCVCSIVHLSHMAHEPSCCRRGCWWL